MSTDAQALDLMLEGRSLTQVDQPAWTDDLRAIVAGGHGPLLVVGGGTHLTFGNSGGEFDTVISTRNLRNVIEYEPDDLTIAVEPGITVAELASILGAQNQMLPIDTPNPERTTLGGLFASGIGGPRRLGYGSLRDWVLGVEVMDATGLVTKSGGMVVKNVTGYDVARLHYAAHGSFGIVTRLNLKVLPLAQASRSIMITYPAAAPAFDAGLAVLASQFEPAAILVSQNDGWAVSIRCDGPLASIDGQANAIVEVATSVSPSNEVSILEEGSRAIDPYLEATDLARERAVARLSIPASGQLEVLERLGQLSGSLLCADPGSGLVYVASLPSIEWREAMRSVDERAVFLALPPDLKTGIDVFGGMDAPNARYLATLKDAFDPDRRFNRGRFVLGL